MTRDDIIKMARESGLADLNGVVHAAYQLETFAQLVAAAEKERIAKKIEQLPFGDTAQSFAIWVRNDT